MKVLSPSKPTGRVRRADRSRAQLLDAALTCFSRDGLEGASVREIADLAKQNVASISYHFGSKENLYHAVLFESMSLIRDAARAALAESGDLAGRRNLTADEAIAQLQRFFSTVFRALIADEKGVRIAPLVVREQTRPTPTFDLLYEQGLRQVHEMLSRLVGLATKARADDPATILRAHAILGQFKILITGRETLLRRLGWKNFKGKNAELATSIINENIRVLLLGLRAGKKSKAGASK